MVDQALRTTVIVLVLAETQLVDDMKMFNSTDSPNSYFLMAEQWELMGKPKKITVTVEAGNTIVPENPLEPTEQEVVE